MVECQKKIKAKERIEIKRKFKHPHGCSQRKVAREFNISPSYINKILKESSNIKCYKKIKRPLMT